MTRCGGEQISTVLSEFDVVGALVGRTPLARDELELFEAVEHFCERRGGNAEEVEKVALTGAAALGVERVKKIETRGSEWLEAFEESAPERQNAMVSALDPKGEGMHGHGVRKGRAAE